MSAAAAPPRRLLRIADPAGGWIALKTARDPRDGARLHREAAMLRRLPGGLAPRCHGIRFAGGATALAMEWIDGPSLAARPPVTWPPILGRLARRLARIHAAGLIHGDIAPRNILCGPAGPVLVDWESAMAIGDPIDAGEGRSVSLGWSHPDLVWGRGRAGVRIDAWSMARLCATAGAAPAAGPRGIPEGDTVA